MHKHEHDPDMVYEVMEACERRYVDSLQQSHPNEYAEYQQIDAEQRRVDERRRRYWERHKEGLKKSIY